MRAIREDKSNPLILDYQLPRLNDMDLSDKMYALHGFDYIPVIRMSAQLPKREIEKHTLVGIRKPFELFDTLEQFLA